MSASRLEPGFSGSQNGSAPGAYDARQRPAADCPLSKEGYLAQHYGAAVETGVGGIEVQVSQAFGSPASPRIQHQEHLTVFDDDV
ncbi:hypothetical protein ACK3TF_000105 [Chlorella vulgaris]